MLSKTKFDAWLNGVIEAGWLAALVLAPLFFNVFSSRVFEPDKISLVRSIALIMLLAWLIKLANGGAAWLPGSTGESATDTPPRPWWQRGLGMPLLLPILLIVAAYLISTGFSVARFVSWWGSYQRLQGTYTFLSYVTIALLTIGHLRRPEQLQRLQYASVITSLPIAIYAILQHRQLDPLPWGGDVTTRVAANAGNAIFLAAYMIMAFFFTLERVFSSFAHLLGRNADAENRGHDVSTSIAGGAYLFILVVQLLAIFWTQSRGPWLGLFFGIYLFVLLLFTALRPKRYRLWTSGWIGLGVAGALLLVAMNTTPYFKWLEDVPYVGRLTTLLEADDGTGRVRVLIWQGAARMAAPHDPLVFPDGRADTINPLRPLVGYGPETMWIAYNPFYPPELAQLEARNASPDRSHNETWDSLVITGGLGFLAYLTLFVAIFFWALRWLGLLVNRRDTLLFGGLLSLTAGGMVLLFNNFTGSWDYFGVALPTGLILGLGAYVTLSAFLHTDLGWTRADLPRQLLLIAILASITAHFVEIHFGIAIAATRTYFWVQTALLVVVGMRWATPAAFTPEQRATDSTPANETASRENSRGRKRGGRVMRPAAPRGGAAGLPATVMVDLLIFFTLVFLYTTNSAARTNPFDILFSAIFQRIYQGAPIFSPYVFFLMLFTWAVAAVIGLATTALQQHRAPDLRWWLRTLGLHALIVWGGWLVYGLIQAARLIPGIAGTDLNSQLGVVEGHFAVFTWVVVAWLATAGIVFALPALRERRLPALGRPALALAAGAVVGIAIFVIIGTVNIGLVRADIIYKQGQQFDAQNNWVSSVELYRRALNARRTEDHYMLFLGRALLEQAKRAPESGTVPLAADATLADVLALPPEAVSSMGQRDLLRAAELVLGEAQKVNPLNTDHTANLARLYRTWSDLSTNGEERQAMLDKSIAEYAMAVTLSPNAAHLWNEKGNAHVARGEHDQAEAAYLHSLSLDNRFDQTYLLLSDHFERTGQQERSVEILEQGLELLPGRPQLLTYLGVAYARVGNLQAAIDITEQVLDVQPNNVGAMRNLAVLHRDQGDIDGALVWTERAIAATPASNTNELLTLRQLAAQLYQTQGRTDQIIVQYEAMRSLLPEDSGVLNTLFNLYRAVENRTAALETLAALTTLEPGNYLYPLLTAQTLRELGRAADAIPYAIQALALAPAEQQPGIRDLIATLELGG